jgi:dTDP-4-dehydrorhamnose reductase
MPRPLILGPLIMGASSRLGRALARVWPDEAPAPLWQTRDGAGGTLAWDILDAPPPDLPAVTGVIVLAGVTHGSAADLAANISLAQAGANLGRRLGVPVLVASTQAVYGAGQGRLREDALLSPTSDYGRAKREMEYAVTAPHVTCLRIGNVAGCDALAAAMARGVVTLDRFSDGQGPRRAMLGPRDLAQVMNALLAAPVRPAVLNVARPGLVAMADILAAAGVPFDWRPAGPEALPTLALDVARLQNICPLPPADAIAMAVQGGWI